jgi:phospholipid transport system transporter-binding protein
MIRIDAQRLILDGAITLDRHVALRAASSEWLDAAQPEVDWSAVTAVDSSALALVLHWLRARPAGAARPRHLALPAGLIALADLYGVEDLLGAGA